MDTTSIWQPFAAETAALVATLRASIVVITTDHGHGCGVIWNSDGLIVTNDHVAGRGPLQVELHDGHKVRATLVARDPYNDLAALRVPLRGLPPAPVGDSTTLRVGELIIAVGHPHGVRDTATMGIISAVGNATWLTAYQEPPRVGVPTRELLQADVALAPGNSGGPLADTAGRVVGIASMILSPGLAIAVPSHVVERFVGAVTRTERLAA